MPFTCSIDTHENLAFVIGTDDFDLAEAAAFVRGVAADPALTPDTRFLVDLSGLASLPTPAQVASLEFVFRAARDRFRGRQAILVHNRAQADVAQLLVLIVGDRAGIPIAIFDDAAQALGWLRADVEAWLFAAFSDTRCALERTRFEEQELSVALR